jgi:hypothetical protein
MDMTHNISQEALIKTIGAVLQDQPDVAFAHLDDLRAYTAEVVRYIHRAGE